MQANPNAPVQSAEKAVDSAIEAGKERFNAMRGRLQAQLNRLRAELDEVDEQARDGVRKAARATDETVHSHPFGAIGIAAAVGLLVG